MLIDRKQLINHLEHINCGGLLPDAVLAGQFSSFGASVDRGLMVIAGDLSKTDPLSEEIGVVNLALLISSLKSIDDDQVNFAVDGRFICVGTVDREYRLATSSTTSISTRLEMTYRDKLMAFFKEQNWVHLEHKLVQGVLKTLPVMKGDQCTVQVSPGGATFVVGTSNLNSVKFSLPVTADLPYNLLLSSERIKSVFGELSDFTKAQIALTGADSIIAIREGDYLYIISPDKPEDEKKA